MKKPNKIREARLNKMRSRKNNIRKDKKPSKTQNKRKSADPLSPFAILKSIKIKK